MVPFFWPQRYTLLDFYESKADFSTSVRFGGGSTPLRTCPCPWLSLPALASHDAGALSARSCTASWFPAMSPAMCVVDVDGYVLLVVGFWPDMLP